MISLSSLLAAQTWPSYLVAVLLTIGLLGVVWLNIRARRRVRRAAEKRRDEESQV
jgi:hypothetical protein